MIEIDAKELIDIITPEDIITLMQDLGADVVKDTTEYFIFPTICHDGSSNKLYYYKSSKTFHCFTHCGNMSVYDLIIKVKDCTFKEAFNYLRNIVNGYNRTIIGFGVRSYKPVNLDDIVVTELLVIDKPFLFNMYSDNKKYMKEWSDEGISDLALDKFNIRFDIRGNRMIIPHFRPDGKCIGIRVRNFNPKDIERAKYQPLFYDDKCYSHPLGNNLYGFNISKDNIKKHKKCILFESEKSTMKYESYYPNNNIAVSICGSNISNTQKKMLLECGVEEVVIALDRQYENENDEEGVMWKNKILKNAQGLNEYCKVSYIWDTDEDRLLEYKSSPIDHGKKTFERLLKNRIVIE